MKCPCYWGRGYRFLCPQSWWLRLGGGKPSPYLASEVEEEIRAMDFTGLREVIERERADGCTEDDCGPLALAIALLEPYVLANSPEYVASMREADEELARGETTSLKDFIKEEWGEDV